VLLARFEFGFNPAQVPALLPARDSSCSHSVAMK
jgi:hypothetical protein